MAIKKGPEDKAVKELNAALGEYESQYPGSETSIYRQNRGAIRVRIVDERFAGKSKSSRHNEVWQFLSERVSEEVMSEVSALLLLQSAEKQTSLANLEFDDPQSSQL